MKGNSSKNVAASVRDRLYQLAQREKQDFNLVLTAFATERFLYRLGCSEHADRFVLKGARLFALWSHKPHRPTRDLDLLGYGDSSQASLHQAFQAICEAKVEPDGLAFDVESIRIEEIRLEKEYDGHRIRLTAHLAQARIPMQIDIGFGDVVTPEAQTLEYTPLLATLPAPRIRAYTRETVIAEKLQAMVALDDLNTRMKDFFDIACLAHDFDCDGQTLCSAIRATFERRKTPIPPEIPSCLLPAFAEDENRRRLWKAFLKRSSLQSASAEDFSTVLTQIRDFVGPPLLAARAEVASLSAHWSAERGWERIATQPTVD